MRAFLLVMVREASRNQRKMESQDRIKRMPCERIRNETLMKLGCDQTACLGG